MTSVSRRGVTRPRSAGSLRPCHHRSRPAGAPSMPGMPGPEGLGPNRSRRERTRSHRDRRIADRWGKTPAASNVLLRVDGSRATRTALPEKKGSSGPRSVVLRATSIDTGTTSYPMLAPAPGRVARIRRSQAQLCERVADVRRGTASRAELIGDVRRGQCPDPFSRSLLGRY